MTSVPGNDGLNKTINLVAVKDSENGTVPAICVKIDRNEPKPPASSQENHDGNALSPSSLATCRSKYPSGCTILECRLDASNRPVAQVLQVPGDSDSTSQKMSVLVEAKQTPSGPYSRVTSCPVKDTNGSSNDQENVGLLKTYALGSGDTCNDNNVNERPISKILYGSMIGETKEALDSQQKCPESTNIFVQCEPTKIKQYAENVTEPQKMIYRSPPNCEDTCPGAKKYPEPSKDKSQTCFSTRRRNGLDPTDSELMLRGSVEKSMRKPNRVCPVTCCKPIEKSVQEKQKPLTCPSPVGVSKKCSKDTFSVSPSEDSLERYKDYVSPNQLEKYRSCRSKRNGLQDECYLPLPRAFLEKEKAERERDYLADDCRKSEKNTNRNQQVQSSHRKSPKTAITDRSSQKSVNKKRRRLKRVKSRELYAGQVFIDCDCYHRNGLQHDCPRTLCGGEPCMEKPLPKCDLGSYFLDKWNNYHDKLDRLMPTSFCGTEEQWLEELIKRKNRNVKQDCKSPDSSK